MTHPAPDNDNRKLWVVELCGRNGNWTATTSVGHTPDQATRKWQIETYDSFEAGNKDTRIRLYRPAEPEKE